MAEIWGAAIMVGGAVLSSQAAKKKAKQDKEDNKEMTREGAKFQGLSDQFNADQAYYYEQKSRQNKERGLAQYRKFSTMGQIDPTYTDDSGGIVVPEKPDAEKYFEEKKDLDNLPDQLGRPKKKKKLTGLLAKDLGLF